MSNRNCTPMGGCGAPGVPFKLTCAAYGYTVVGKGTTSCQWQELLREADVYHVLQQAQGSAVPVFLGAIDMMKTYFFHGAGAIRHMLLMAWGGESTSNIGYHYCSSHRSWMRCLPLSVVEFQFELITGAMKSCLFICSAWPTNTNHNRNLRGGFRNVAAGGQAWTVQYFRGLIKGTSHEHDQHSGCRVLNGVSHVEANLYKM